MSTKCFVCKVRSLSGVLVVTVLTSPHPEYVDETTGRRKTQTFSCKHNCYYCPNEPAHEGNNFIPQPRSYLHDEPGVLRANQVGFINCVCTRNSGPVEIQTPSYNTHLDNVIIIPLVWV